MNLHDFCDALTEVLHYADLYAALPSNHQPVSTLLGLAESHAIRHRYIDGCALTAKGAEWLRMWGDVLKDSEGVAA